MKIKVIDIIKLKDNPLDNLVYGCVLHLTTNEKSKFLTCEKIDE